MNPDIKNRWTTKLRSGEYKQGRNNLRVYDVANEEERFCCLGVLCEIAVEDGIIPPANTTSVVRRYGVDEAYGSIGILPTVVKEWAELDYPNGGYGIGDVHALSNDNDTGKSFDQIADIIDQNF